MYGSVAFLRLKPGAEEEFQGIARGFEQRNVPGVVFDYAYRLDAADNVYVLVVGFESKSAYEANANSPEQHEQYLQYRALLEADPEWHDGEIVYSYQRP